MSTSTGLPMKILVMDDNQTHRNAANAQLEGHDVTIVDNFDAAVELICPEYKDGAYHPRNWDIVLTDLLVPATRKAQGPEGEQHVGKEMPLGSIVVLIAQSHGVKKIGLLTDHNHHNHPASAALDCLAHRGAKGLKHGVHSTGNGLLFVAQDTCWVDAETFLYIGHGAETDKQYPYLNGRYVERKGAVKSKDWKEALDALLEPQAPKNQIE